MAISILKPNSAVDVLRYNESVKTDNDDATAGYLIDKILAGDNVSFDIITQGGNRSIQISAIASAGANTVAISTADETPGTLEQKLLAGNNVSLVKSGSTNELLTINAEGGSALETTYTPLTSANWNLPAPAEVQTGLDQLAARLRVVENNFPINASVVNYTADDITNWDGDINPGEVNDALDQLASRVTLIEAGTVAPIAEQVSFTPTTLANWGGIDPEQVKAALDYLANRIQNGLDASFVGYVPNTPANWNGGIDPGNTNNALDQLASRLKIVESFGEGTVRTSSNDSTSGFLGQKLLSGTGIQLVESAGSNRTITINRLAIDAADVVYTPANLSDWNGGIDPGDTDNALDQLASRLKAVESSTTNPDAANVTYTDANQVNWGGVSPANVKLALDRLALRTHTLEGRTTNIESQLSTVRVSATDFQSNFLEGKIWPGNGINIVKNDPPGNIQALIVSATFNGTSQAVSYAPTTPADWVNIVGAPDDVREALDNLASVIALGASVIRYAPDDDDNWDTVPNIIGSALDELAARVEVIENDTGGGDATTVTYTPDESTDWETGNIPDYVQGGLDQLASRVKTIESGSQALTGFFSSNTLIDDDYTILANHQVVYYGAVDYTENGSITIEPGGELIIKSALDFDNTVRIAHTATDLNDWINNENPDNAQEAINQLASRVSLVEAGTTYAVVRSRSIVIPQSGSAVLSFDPYADTHLETANITHEYDIDEFVLTSINPVLASSAVGNFNLSISAVSNSSAEFEVFYQDVTADNLNVTPSGGTKIAAHHNNDYAPADNTYPLQCNQIALWSGGELNPRFYYFYVVNNGSDSISITFNQQVTWTAIS